MNVIDKAFAKAYARRAQPQSSQPTVEPGPAPELPCLQSADMTVHPQASESAVMWLDSVADQYLRRDPCHGSAESLGDTPAHEDLQPRQAPVPKLAPAEEVLQHSAQAEPTNGIDLSSLYASEVTFAVQPALLVNEPAGNEPQQETGYATAAAAAPSAEPLPAAASATATGPAAVVPAPEPFLAAWEVDRLEFSSTIMALFADPALVQSIGHPLDRAVNEGLQTLLITGDRTGVGRTSVASGIAISAAAAGLRVALVDAASAPTDNAAHALAVALNLDVQHGWPEALRAGRSVAEAAVHSIEDQLTVIPQASSGQSIGPTADEFKRLIASLREAFDLVVIDGPCCREADFKNFTAIDRPVSHTPPTFGGSSARPPVDAVILVQDIRNADRMLAKQVMQSLRFHGITGLGFVENFT